MSMNDPILAIFFIQDIAGSVLPAWKTTIVTGDMPGHTATVMVRAELFSFDGGQRIAFNEVRANGDKKLLMLLAAQNCRIHVLPDIMSAHRVVYSGGSSWTASIQGKNMSGKFFLANLDIR